MKTKQKLIVSFLSLALVFGMIPATGVSAAEKPSMSKKITITEGASKSIKVKNTGKTVKWKIVSGKKYIILKKKGKTAATVKGKKKGKAKVQATAGGKKLTCTVTVENAKNKNDVAALNALIAQQRKQGAQVSKNISDSAEYVWENGRLVEIMWKNSNLKGKISFSSLPALTRLWCSGNNLTELDVSKNTKLEWLYCYKNKLTKLDVSKNTALRRLYCYNNKITKLDMSNNIMVKQLECDKAVKITGYNGSENSIGKRPK